MYKVIIEDIATKHTKIKILSLSNAYNYIDEYIRDICEIKQGHKKDKEIFKKIKTHNIKCYCIINYHEYIIMENIDNPGIFYTSWKSVPIIKITLEKMENSIIPYRNSEMIDVEKNKFNEILISLIIDDINNEINISNNEIENEETLP